MEATTRPGRTVTGIALADFAAAHTLGLTRFAYVLCGDRGLAEDLVQDAMWRALATLPDRQRAVLVLRYYLDLSDTDIAAALGCREGTVRSLASRAFAALREHPALTIPGDAR